MNKLHLAFTGLLLALSLTVNAGSNSLTLNVKTTITAGTCTAQVRDSSNHASSTITFGDVYMDHVASKSSVKTFSLVFADCAGLAQNIASVTLIPRGQCDGPQADGNAFANVYTGTAAAAGIAVEVWTTQTPEGNGSVQLSCMAKPVKSIDVSTAKNGTQLQWPLSARLVIAKNTPSDQVNAGDFSAPATFTIAYQ